VRGYLHDESIPPWVFDILRRMSPEKADTVLQANRARTAALVDCDGADESTPGAPYDLRHACLSTWLTCSASRPSSHQRADGDHGLPQPEATPATYPGAGRRGELEP